MTEPTRLIFERRVKYIYRQFRDLSTFIAQIQRALDASIAAALFYPLLLLQFSVTQEVRQYSSLLLTKLTAFQLFSELDVGDRLSYYCRSATEGAE